MPRKRRAKPKSPAEIAEALARDRAQKREALKNPEKWGADGKTLSKQPDVAIVRDAKGKVQAARRDDVFDRLLARNALSTAAHQSIRRLEADMAERRGEGERGHSPGKVDAAGSSDLVTQRMIDAGARVEGALRMVGVRDAALLREMLEPFKVHAPAVDRWRLVVRTLTGEATPHGQAARLRAACDNLVEAYREIDHSPRRAAA